MAVVNLVNGESNDAHPATLTASLVGNAKPDLADTATKTATLKGILLDAVNKVTVVTYHRMVLLPEAFELAFKL